MAQITKEKSIHEPLKTFVGGLPYVCSEEDLSLFMGQFGMVEEVYLSRDHQLGTHKGFAFVTFKEVYSLKLLFGEHNYRGKPIEVKRNLQNQLTLSGLTTRITEKDVKAAFEEKGFEVVSVMMGGMTPGLCSGTACVRFKDNECLSEAASLGFLKISGTSVEIHAKSPRRFPQSNKESPKKKLNFESHIAEMRPRGGSRVEIETNSKKVISLGDFSNQTSECGLAKPEFDKSMTNSGISTTLFNKTEGEPNSPNLTSSAPQRKLSSNLKTNSKEYHPLIKNVSVHVVRTDSQTEVELMSLSTPAFESFQSGDHQNAMSPSSTFSGVPRLSSTSISFFGSRDGKPIKREVLVNFFTFPGRE